MRSPFSFEGGIGRLAYVASSLAVFFCQHLFVAVTLMAYGKSFRPDAWFWINPLHLVTRSYVSLPEWIQVLTMVIALAASWSLVALAFRRTRSDSELSIAAAFAVVPICQPFVIAFLGYLPKWEPSNPDGQAPAGVLTARTAVTGLLIGAGLSVLAVAFSTLVLRLYGYGLFMASPFVIGAVTAFVANRQEDLPNRKTFPLILGALCLGALGLITFALEGAICLVFAAPLIGALALVGSLFGRALARRLRRRCLRKGVTLTGFSLLPLLMAAELLLPPRASFESIESIVVAAPAEAVWDAVVHMGPIADPPAPPFRWGLAYPMSGEITGAGVNAIRRGVFSTGVAYERVTEWEPNRKLSFIVLSDPPTMAEFSPYERVNAPHVRGYFRTLDARFTIEPLSTGKTRLALATKHELDLEPALYWLPFAEWAVQTNKERVLQHFQQQAERGVGTKAPA